MEHDEFIASVRRRTSLASREDAERAVKATLESLGEQLIGARGSPEALASKLPSQIGRHLREAKPPADRPSLDSFFDRISEKEGMDLRIAVGHAKGVFETLEASVDAQALNTTRAQLPEEFELLFEPVGA